MRKPLQLAGLVACLTAGIVLATAVAGSVQAAGTTTDETTTESVTETASAPTTIVTTATVERTTTTRQIILPATTTTSSDSSSSEGTPVWVWVLLGILAVALITAIALLASRRGGSALSPDERRRRLDGAVASWAAQGWALESQGVDSAVLQRSGERMLVTVDPSGQLSTRPY